MLVSWKEWVNIVLEIGPEGLDHSRKRIANIEALRERNDDASEGVRIITGIFHTLIDSAFGVSAEQLARGQRLSPSFEKAAKHAIDKWSEKARLVDLGDEGAITQNPNPEGQHGPQNGYQKGSDILPRL